jgi:hypothetical protein
MVPPKYQFEYLAGKRILLATTRGFWTEDTARAYMDALSREMAKVRRTCSRFSLLSDAREFPVQSEGVMKILAAQSAANEGVRKLAILVSSTLNSMQAQRSFQSDRIEVFKDMDDAVAWLETSTKLIEP